MFIIAKLNKTAKDRDVTWLAEAAEGVHYFTSQWNDKLYFMSINAARERMDKVKSEMVLPEGQEICIQELILRRVTE